MSLFHLGILRTASWLVPQEKRVEWLTEWRSELWQLRKAEGATVFCLGSFFDAAWLRWNHPRKGLQLQLESPWQCLFFLATLAALSLFLALRLPHVSLTPALARLAPRPPLFQFSMMVALACAILPATTSLSLGEYQTSSGSQRRFTFLAGKVLLILPSVYAGCVCIYYQAIARQSSPLGIQVLLVACILAFRWALNDQRRRCPQCLRLLGHAARVGQPARNFLEWNGLELMCARGHGLLYIPATPADWSPRPRWLALDSSWRSLFPQSDAGVSIPSAAR